MPDNKEEVYDISRTLERNRNLILKDPAIREENKQTILQYERQSEARGIGPMRRSMYLQNLRRVAKLTNADFRSITKSDLEELMRSLNAASLREWTKQTTRVVMKTFLREIGVPEENFKWVKGRKGHNRITSEDLLTEGETRRLIHVASSRKWASIIAFLAETGCRPGEALTASTSSIRMNHEYATANLSGKTGQRQVFVVSGGPFAAYDLLKDWLEHHPSPNDPNAPAWPADRQPSRPISLASLNVTLRRMGKKAGVIKKVYPYLLRHCAATAAYAKHAPHVAQKMLGHRDIGTSMFYVHLSDQDVLDALREGSAKREAEQKDVCPCGHQNAMGTLRCAKCQKPLSPAALAMDTEQENVNEINRLLQRPEVMRAIQAIANADNAKLRKIKEALA